MIGPFPAVDPSGHRAGRRDASAQNVLTSTVGDLADPAPGRQQSQEGPAHATLQNSSFRRREPLPHHHPIAPAVYIHPSDCGRGYLDACGQFVDDPHCARHYSHYQPGMIEARVAYRLFKVGTLPTPGNVPAVACVPTICATQGCRRAVSGCLHERQPRAFRALVEGMK